MNPRRVTHNLTKFHDHISGTVPNVIMATIDFDAMVHKTDQPGPSFIEIDNTMHNDYAKRDELWPDE